jgi:hypothetical protein
MAKTGLGLQVPQEGAADGGKGAQGSPSHSGATWHPAKRQGLTRTLDYALVAAAILSSTWLLKEFGRQWLSVAMTRHNT